MTRQGPGWGTLAERREADLFARDLFGESTPRPVQVTEADPPHFVPQANIGAPTDISRAWFTRIPQQDRPLHGPIFRAALGPGHYFGRPATNRATWGQFLLVFFLARLSNRWALTELGRNHPFGVGDLGNENGSHVHSHSSHHYGLAGDFYIINTNGNVRRHEVDNSPRDKTVVNTPGYDRTRNTKLLELVVDLALESHRPDRPGYVFEKILFNDSAVANEINAYAHAKATERFASLGQPVPNVFQFGRGMPGLVRHHVNHEDHFHFRFVKGAPAFSEQEIANALSIMRVL